MKGRSRDGPLGRLLMGRSRDAPLGRLLMGRRQERDVPPERLYEAGSRRFARGLELVPFHPEPAARSQTLQCKHLRQPAFCDYADRT